jgi:putative transposase
MSMADRRAMVERPGKDLPVRRQCTLLNLARPGVYRPKPVPAADDLALMRRIDALHLELPCLRLAADDVRTQQGRPWGQPEAGAAADARDGDRSFGSAPRHEQSRAWTQDISLPAAGPCDHRAEPRVGFRHHLYPDGARLSVSRGDHRLGQPGGSGLAAVEHHRQRVLRRSAGGGSGRHGKPRIFNTDQGAQFTSAAFTGKLEAAGVAISMDGRGRFMDNIFIERLWRSIKYEEVHLKAYADGREARAGIGSWMTLYNFRRPHQAMNNPMPMAAWRAGMDKIAAAQRAVDMPLRLDNVNALPTYPQQKQQEAA